MAYILPQPAREETAPYVFYKDLFSKEECQKIISLKELIGPEVAKIGGSTEEGNVDTLKRRTELRWIHWNPEMNWIFERLSHSIASANNKWWGYHLAGMNEPLQLTHYKSEDLGHYDWHEDHGHTGNFLHRKLSCVMPLNDAFEGGDFEIFQMGKPVELSVGTLLIFPSFKVHRVTPVTNGERWSLVNWVNGPPFC
jgi:PKHD-type hydroxylase